MRLFNMKKNVIDQTVKLSISIDSEKLGKRELWFSTELQYEDSICEDQYDAFLVGLLFPAMKYGENIHIEGKVSKKLLFNVNHYAIPLIKSFSPSCKNIQVTAIETTSDKSQGNGIGTGFSGGIDSFCTVYDNLELEDDPEHKINSFLFLNVGAHGSEDAEKVRKKFKMRYDYLKKFPDELGLDFIPVDSNLYEFHPWGHQKTHTLTSVSGIMFLQNIYDKYYYASAGLNYESLISSSLKYRDIDIGAYSDTMLLPLLSTESLELVPDGNQYTRTEKTLNIMGYEPVKRYLNVCISGDDTHENCSICSKCCRTLMTLNSVDKLNEFDHLFDINKYKTIAEKKYISGQVLSQNKDPFAKGNIELAEINNIKLPNKLLSLTILTPKLVRGEIIKMLRNKLTEETTKKLKEILKR